MMSLQAADYTRPVGAPTGSFRLPDVAAKLSFKCRPGEETQSSAADSWPALLAFAGIYPQETHVPHTTTSARIRLVVFDWAGTTVDHGCFAPVAPFIGAFQEAGVAITAPQARAPMGLHKRDHIVALLQQQEIAAAWRQKYGRDWTEADVDQLYAAFIPKQLASVVAVSRLVPGVLETVAELRRRDVKIATTTGFFKEAAALVYQTAREQGYAPDASLSAGDVERGRPAPWMIFRLMEQLDVFPPAAVIKIGDTEPDIGEGRNAGVWSVGVVATGSEVGLTAEELAALSTSERNSRLAAARQKLLAAGAHYVVDSVADLPRLLVEIEERLQSGDRP